ncbi:MAG: hypothetical protein WAL98_14385 [Desulfatiglandaceae bacterium]
MTFFNEFNCQRNKIAVLRESVVHRRDATYTGGGSEVMTKELVSTNGTTAGKGQILFYEVEVNAAVGSLNRIGLWLGAEGITSLLDPLSPAKQLLETFKAAQQRMPKRVFLARWCWPTDRASGATPPWPSWLVTRQVTNTSLLTMMFNWR